MESFGGAARRKRMGEDNVKPPEYIKIFSRENINSDTLEAAIEDTKRFFVDGDGNLTREVKALEVLSPKEVTELLILFAEGQKLGAKRDWFFERFSSKLKPGTHRRLGELFKGEQEDFVVPTLDDAVMSSIVFVGLKYKDLCGYGYFTEPDKGGGAGRKSVFGLDPQLGRRQLDYRFSDIDAGKALQDSGSKPLGEGPTEERKKRFSRLVKKLSSNFRRSSDEGEKAPAEKKPQVPEAPTREIEFPVRKAEEFSEDEGLLFGDDVFSRGDIDLSILRGMVGNSKQFLDVKKDDPRIRTLSRFLNVLSLEEVADLVGLLHEAVKQGKDVDWFNKESLSKLKPSTLQELEGIAEEEMKGEIGGVRAALEGVLDSNENFEEIIGDALQAGVRGIVGSRLRACIGGVMFCYKNMPRPGGAPSSSVFDFTPPGEETLTKSHHQGINLKALGNAMRDTVEGQSMFGLSSDKLSKALKESGGEYGKLREIHGKSDLDLGKQDLFVGMLLTTLGLEKVAELVRSVEGKRFVDCVGVMRGACNTAYGRLDERLKGQGMGVGSEYVKDYIKRMYLHRMLDSLEKGGNLGEGHVSGRDGEDNIVEYELFLCVKEIASKYAKIATLGEGFPAAEPEKPGSGVGRMAKSSGLSGVDPERIRRLSRIAKKAKQFKASRGPSKSDGLGRQKKEGVKKIDLTLPDEVLKKVDEVFPIHGFKLTSPLAPHKAGKAREGAKEACQLMFGRILLGEGAQNLIDVLDRVGGLSKSDDKLLALYGLAYLGRGYNLQDRVKGMASRWSSDVDISKVRGELKPQGLRNWKGVKARLTEELDKCPIPAPPWLLTERGVAKLNSVFGLGGAGVETRRYLTEQVRRLNEAYDLVKFADSRREGLFTEALDGIKSISTGVNQSKMPELFKLFVDSCLMSRDPKYYQSENDRPILEGQLKKPQEVCRNMKNYGFKYDSRFSHLLDNK